MRGLLLVAGALLTLTGSAGAAGSTLFVDDDAPEGGDGLTWPTALRSLQDALALAREDGSGVNAIHVAGGVYQPDDGDGITPGDRTVAFDLVSGVALKGGFAGPGAKDPDERDIIAYESVLDGDLAGDDLPGFENYGDNSLHLVTATGVSDATTLDGFTVRGGNQDEMFGHGGGMLVQGGSPSIIECLFLRNIAFLGGAVALLDTLADVTGTMFDSNRARGTGNGGGLYASGGAPTAGDCLFINNSTTFEDGGGVFAPGAPIMLFDCDFIGNGADDGGGAYLGSNGLVMQCRFEENGAAFGGAVTSFSGPTLIDCDFIHNQAGDGGALYGGGTLFNCTFVANEASHGGGALLFVESLFVNVLLNGNDSSFGTGGGALVAGETPVQFINSTFTRNSSGGAAGAASGNGTFTNCIIWNNFPLELDGAPQVTWSCIRDGWPGEGNIAEDPQFADPAGKDGVPGTLDDDLHLSAESPCIDAGDNTALPPDTFDFDGDGDVEEPIPFDLDGNDRFVDDPATEDTGQPDGSNPLVDMGVFEFSPRSIPGDLDGDGDVDGKDLLLLLSGWGPCPDPPADCPADFDGSGSVNFMDLLVLLSHWS